MMAITGFAICIIGIIFTARLLYRNYNPQGVLITSGLLMMGIAAAIGLGDVVVAKPSGTIIFDMVQIIDEGFITNLSRIGVMIMTIGGYVAFMNSIKATDALVYLAMKPLSSFRKYPMLAAVITIPIGQVLFMTVPSAAGLGLLLVASFYPVLVNLGVSRLTALSVIAAATIFDQGPSSANTAMAAGLIGTTNVEYFITSQLPVVIPTTAVVMVLYFFSNRYFDRKDIEAGKEIFAQPAATNGKPDVPLLFSVLPMLPLVLLVVFSQYVGLFDIHLSTTAAMLFSLVVSVLLIAIYKRNFKKVMGLLEGFWKGMGSVFTTVITLIVAAEIFAKGLNSLGFIDSLVSGSTHIGLSGVMITIVMSILIFLAAMLTGSGNAAFFSFGPLIPDVAVKLGLKSWEMILPMQLAASMGRATSPIAGVIVAIAGVAGVSPVDVAKRNLLPLAGGLVFLQIFHFLF